MIQVTLLHVYLQKAPKLLFFCNTFNNQPGCSRWARPGLVHKLTARKDARKITAFPQKRSSEMELSQLEVSAVQEVSAEAKELQTRDLIDLQLTLLGGGCADPIFV